MIFSIILAVVASSVQSCPTGFTEVGPTKQTLPPCPAGFAASPRTGANQFKNCAKTVNGLVVKKARQCPKEPYKLNSPDYWKKPILDATSNGGTCTWFACTKN